MQDVCFDHSLKYNKTWIYKRSQRLGFKKPYCHFFKVYVKQIIVLDNNSVKSVKMISGANIKQASSVPSPAGVVRLGLASVWTWHWSPGLDGVLRCVRPAAGHHVVLPLSGPQPSGSHEHVQQRPAGGSDADAALVLHPSVDQAAEAPQGAHHHRPPPHPLLSGVRGLPAAPRPQEVLLRPAAVGAAAAGPSTALRLQLLRLAGGRGLGSRGQAVHPRCEGDHELSQSQASFLSDESACV